MRSHRRIKKYFEASGTTASNNQPMSLFLSLEVSQAILGEEGVLVILDLAGFCGSRIQDLGPMVLGPTRITHGSA